VTTQNAAARGSVGKARRRRATAAVVAVEVGVRVVI
jgi:hypothetical protein